MNRIVTILFLSACLTTIQAQNDIFVLVDVSRSIRQSELNDAKQALTEVLTGVNPSRAFIAYGNQTDLTNYKANVNNKIAISKFGSLNTTIAINPTPITIQNIGSDVNSMVNSITWTPIDQQTYFNLAKAKIAEYAKRNKINIYKLCIISDNINDDFGPNGTPNYPNQYTRELAEGYNTTSNPVKETWTKLKFNQNSNFTLSFSSVDVSRYILPTGPGITPPPPEPAIIKISSPIGTRSKEAESKSKNLTVSWTCTNCPADINYSVRISGYDGNKFNDTRNNLTSNSTTFNNLSGGKYRITVSDSNYSAASDTTFVNINAGGLGWIIPLLLLAAAGGAAYYFWNKRRQKKLNATQSDNYNSSDIYNQNSDPTTSYPSNPEYF